MPDRKRAEGKPLAFVFPDSDNKTPGRLSAIRSVHIDKQLVFAANRKEILPADPALAQLESHFVQTRAFDYRHVRREKPAWRRRVQTNIDRRVVHGTAVGVGNQQRQVGGIGERAQQLNSRCSFEVDVQVLGPDRRDKNKSGEENRNVKGGF